MRMNGGPSQRPSRAARRNARDMSMYSAATSSFRTGLFGMAVLGVLLRDMHAV
jgi:hypothetical protein